MKNILNFKLVGTIIMCLSYIMFIGYVSSMNNNHIDNLIIDVAAFLYVSIMSARWWTYDDNDDDKITNIGYIARYVGMAGFGIFYSLWVVEGTITVLSPVSNLLTVISALAVGIFSILHIFTYVIYIADCNERGKTVCK